MRFILLLILTLLMALNAMSQNPHLNSEANNLLEYLWKLPTDHGKTLFGVANGVSRSYNNLDAGNGIPGDCRQITGKDPGFVENDFLFKRDKTFWDNEYRNTKSAISRGIVVGYCYHLGGYNSGTFRPEPADKDLVKKIIGKKDCPEKDWYFSLLDTVVTPVFMDIAKPVIYRPFHEMNGNWFWWGRDNCTPEEYIQLYRLTVERLRANGLNNVIMCWSPDTRLAEEYYPGDDYVDIVGLDVYEPGCSPYHGTEAYAKALKDLDAFAVNHKKVAVISETGLREYEGVMRFPMEIPDFWSRMVFAPILDSPQNSHISYVMSWYNANWSKNNRGSLYVPYKGIEKVYGDKGKQAIKDMKKLSKNRRVIFVK